MGNNYRDLKIKYKEHYKKLSFTDDKKTSNDSTGMIARNFITSPFQNQCVCVCRPLKWGINAGTFSAYLLYISPNSFRTIPSSSLASRI